VLATPARWSRSRPAPAPCGCWMCPPASAGHLHPAGRIGAGRVPSCRRPAGPPDPEAFFLVLACRPRSRHQRRPAPPPSRPHRRAGRVPGRRWPDATARHPSSGGWRSGLHPAGHVGALVEFLAGYHLGLSRIGPRTEERVSSPACRGIPSMRMRRGTRNG
jgi:hypothetical protein